jgi:hypothetical protein
MRLESVFELSLKVLELPKEKMPKPKPEDLNF